MKTGHAGLRDLADAELRRKVQDNETELFNLRFAASVTPLKNPHRVRQLKREVAACLTILRARELAAAKGKE